MSRRGPLAVVAGVLTSIVGGAVTVLTGLTDLGWTVAHTDLWYPIASTVTRFIGPNVAPGIPWELLTMVIGGALIATLLIRAYRNRKKATP